LLQPVQGLVEGRLGDVARELRRHCDLQLRDVPSSIQGFVERREGKDRDIQLPLPMRPV
jgi:hypothetical protein